MKSDFQRILESKATYRRKLAGLPIGEKLRMLDEMRERALTLQHAAPDGLRGPRGSRGVFRAENEPRGRQGSRRRGG